MDGLMAGQNSSADRSVLQYHPVAFSIGGASVNSNAPSENFSLGQGQAPLLQKLPAVQEETSGRNTKFFGAVFLLMNAILGSGLLGQAYAASQSGVALYLVCLLVRAEIERSVAAPLHFLSLQAMAGCAFYAIFLLLICCELKGVTSYEAVGFAAYGAVGRTVAAVIIAMQNFGALTGYIVILKDLLPRLVAEAGGFEVGHGPWWSHPSLLVVGLVLCVVWPMTWLRDIGALGYTSGFSITVMLLFTIVIVVRSGSISCTEAVQRLDLAHTEGCAAHATHFDAGFAEVFPTLAFSFVCHTALLPIYTELKTRTVGHMLKVAGASMGACFTLYGLAGVFGYLAFRGATQGDLLDQMAQYSPSDKLVLACRILVAASVTVTIPLINYPARRAITMAACYSSRNAFSWTRHIAIGTGTLALVTLLALVVPSITTVFGVAGCTTSVGLVFVLPGVFYIRLTKMTGVNGDFSGHRLGALLLVSGALVVGVASLVGVISRLL